MHQLIHLLPQIRFNTDLEAVDGYNSNLQSLTESISDKNHRRLA